MYRLIVCCIVLVTLCVPPLAAAPSQKLHVDLAGGTSSQVVADDLLFFELEELSGPDQLIDVSYSVDREPFFVERITLRQRRAPDGSDSTEHPSAVELLAWHPEIRAELFAKRSQGSLVTITVSPLDGASSTFAFDDLLGRSHELQALGLMPASNRSEVVLSTVPSSAPTNAEAKSTLLAKGACENQCADDQWWCEANCGGPGDEQCYHECDIAYQYCLDDCQGCTGPTIQEYTVTQVISNVYIGPTVCQGQPGFNGFVAEYRYLKIKYTRYRKTTNCDGSTTTEVIGISYYDGNCWALGGLCYSPIGFVTPVCPICEFPVVRESVLTLSLTTSYGHIPTPPCPWMRQLFRPRRLWDL